MTHFHNTISSVLRVTGNKKSPNDPMTRIHCSQGDPLAPLHTLIPVLTTNFVRRKIRRRIG
jgi:hypothetical protein